MTRTLDNFLDGRIKLIQPSSGYRAGIDTIFLSASLQPKGPEKILDIGSGVGTAAMALAFRCPQITVTGIEIQPDLCELAHQNIVTNNFTDRVDVLHGDILCPPAAFKENSFDQVMTNPPYYEDGRTQSSPDPGKAQAHIETADLDVWIKRCFKLLKPKGIFTIIHRAERLSEILIPLENLAGDMVVYPLWPGPQKSARRVLVQARKNTGGELRLARGMVLHGGKDKYTPEAEAVLRHAHGLVL